jgi:hypothetical protein
MAAAPVMVAVGDKRYTLSPLTLGAIAALEKWCMERPFVLLRERKAAYPELFAGEALLHELDAARTESSRRDQSALNSLDGFREILRQRLLPKHPDISDSEINAIIDAHSMDALKEVGDRLDDSGNVMSAPAAG